MERVAADDDVRTSTQVTAAITAADIQNQGRPQVTVVNATPAGTSAGVSFAVIPSMANILSVLGSIATMTAVKFAAQQSALDNAVTNLQSYLTNQSASINNLNAQLSAANNQVASLSSQNASLNQQVQQQGTQITQLQSQIAVAGNQTASPLEIAQSLKGVVDQIQQTAANTAGMQTTLTNLNVQMKTLVNVARDSQTGEADRAAGFSRPQSAARPRIVMYRFIFRLARYRTSMPRSRAERDRQAVRRQQIHRLPRNAAHRAYRLRRWHRRLRAAALLRRNANHSTIPRGVAIGSAVVA